MSFGKALFAMLTFTQPNSKQPKNLSKYSKDFECVCKTFEVWQHLNSNLSFVTAVLFWGCYPSTEVRKSTLCCGKSSAKMCVLEYVRSQCSIKADFVITGLCKQLHIPYKVCYLWTIAVVRIILDPLQAIQLLISALYS